jgi:uncharacterized membrane-anchored protein
MPISFTLINCAVYNIPEGVLFIPDNQDYVTIAHKCKQNKYCGHFIMDEAFLRFVCKEELYDASIYKGFPEYQRYYILNIKQ